jgi:hypothetical protein
MTSGCLVEIGTSAPVICERLVNVVYGLWNELGLTSSPVVKAIDGPQGRITVDGRLVPISARRIAAAQLAATDAEAVLALMVDAALRSDLANLVRAEHGVDPSVVLAAELSLNPAQLADHGEPPESVPSDDLFARCEWLVAQRTGIAPLHPAIVLHPTTMRRLTTGTARLGPDLMVGQRERGLRGMKDELFAEYGAEIPPVGLHLGEQPESLVRFVIGGMRTGAHYVLAEDECVVTTDPSNLPSAASARPCIDPQYGARWSIVDESWQADDGDTTVLDPAAWVVRCLTAELKTRLGLFAPTEWDLRWRWSWPANIAFSLPLERAAASFRWLLASQGTVQPMARLTEGVIMAEAEHETSIEAMTARFRRLLGPAMQGPIPTAVDHRILPLDDALAEVAVRADSAEPLVTALPELTSTVEQLVVVCSSPWHRDVTRLLRPLADVAIVIQPNEVVPPAAFAAPSEHISGSLQVRRRSMTLSDRLWSDDAEARFGGDQKAYQAAILDQYKLYVEMADRISQRRGLTNTFFLTLNTAIFTLVGVFWKDKPNTSVWWLILPLIILLCQCFAWFYLVRSYRLLNSAKYEVVGALEERLPASPYWRAEWWALGEGKDRRKFWPLSHIEKWIPLLFGSAYIVGFIALLVS